MKFKEYGKKGSPVVVLIHGEYASSWNFEEEALLLSDHFHVILPQWGFDNEFESIHQSSQEVIDYIEKKHYGRISILAGTGMGGQIVLDILAENPFICSDCILESVPVNINKNGTISTSLSYVISKIPFMLRLKACRLHIPGEKYEEFCYDQKREKYETYKKKMQEKNTYQIPKLYRVQAKTLILVGESEKKMYKKSAQALYRKIIDSELETTKTHISGEFSRNHTQYYIVRLLKLYQSIL